MSVDRDATSRWCKNVQVVFPPVSASRSELQLCKVLFQPKNRDGERFYFILIMACNIAPGFSFEFQPIMQNCTASATGEAVDPYVILNWTAGCELWKKICIDRQNMGKTPLTVQWDHLHNITFFCTELSFQRDLRRNVLFQTWSQNHLAFGRISVYRTTLLYCYELICFISTLWV